MAIFRMIHKAVYWSPSGLNDSGQSTYSAPIEISCFFVDCGESKTFTEFRDAEIKSKFHTYSVVVKKGMILKTTLNSLSAAQKANPELAQAAEIQIVKSITDPNGKNQSYLGYC